MLRLDSLTGAAQLSTGVVQGPPTDTGHVPVRCADDHTVVARPALAVPCELSVGDEVLLISQDDAAFIIGVLAFAAGAHATLHYPGGLTVRAEGDLQLQSATRLEANAPLVRAEAGRAELEARSLFQRVSDSFVWVRNLLQRRLGRSRTTVEGADETTAHTSTLRAEDIVKIDGREIHIG